MDAAKSVSEPLHGFMIDSVRLVRRCNKPDRKEFIKISSATAIGFAVMGFIGFFVRLIHIPVNSILLGKSRRVVDAIFCFYRFARAPSVDTIC
ncbi:unnamed protein product [Chondrus crispus]|uniref:Protein transport protein Sec61 subunit gamma n=1 Tax=Chondrus crispus TaxID=2769 RepID=R7QAF6_CHOCR|nr:unnamed protein product [Chondrus crispus]CDF35024.1 unnamed protein product [Chondrus crispus]|eukprot:XP_005714843.1 unnamed protein product [Chondrus crispus]